MIAATGHPPKGCVDSNLTVRLCPEFTSNFSSGRDPDPLVATRARPKDGRCTSDISGGSCGSSGEFPSAGVINQDTPASLWAMARHGRQVGWTLMFLGALAGCGDDGDAGSPDGGAPTSTSPGTSGSSADSTAAPGTDEGETGTSTLGAPAMETPCGTLTCAPDEYCSWSPKFCGEQLGTQQSVGACLPRPPNCPAYEPPSCGCDGKVYRSSCEARRLGVDVGVEDGLCEAPPNLVGCGPVFCDPYTEYCTDDPEEEYGLTCSPLPAACIGANTCDCLQRGLDLCLS
jgi:hypothetical protein